MMIGGSSTAMGAGIAGVYDRTAPVYDRLTAHHDYELWLGNLLPALELHGLAHGRLLDVACGTGKSFIPMLDRGWSVTAVDVSERMLDVARAKVGERVAFRSTDMRNLPTLGEFELVWCLDDAINYLLTRGELNACLSGLRRNLGPGGLCVFDVNTLASYRGFFASTEVIDAGNERLIWRGHEAADFEPGALAEATLEIESDSTSERVVHRQRHFLADQIEDALANADLDLVAVYGITPAAVLERPLDELRHTKAIFVSQPALRR
jgi:SAM-dependent methyltransferase